MVRRYESHYHLRERDDVLARLRAILKDLDLRADAIEKIADDFKAGNRLDVDALLASINADLAQKSSDIQAVLDEIEVGFTPDRIAETPEKRFTSDSEQQAHTDALATKANASCLGAHTGNNGNPHGVTAEQVDAYTKAEADALLTDKAETSREVAAGDGLSGGGDLSADRAIALGAPSTLDADTANEVTGTTHTHAIDEASIVTAGIAGQTSLGVGTYAMLRHNLGSGSLTTGTARAGSNLRAANAAGTGTPAAVPGTWRIEGHIEDLAGSGPDRVSLFRRIL